MVENVEDISNLTATNRGGLGSRIIEEVPAVDTAENIIHCVLDASEVGLKH
jgi:hypothetical protein